MTTTQQASSLAGILETVRNAEAGAVEGLQPLRISVLRNYTVEGMLPLLKFHCLRSGLNPTITLGEYDNIRQEILDPGSHLYTSGPELIVLSVYLEHLDPACIEASWDPSVAQGAMLSMLQELIARTRVPVIVNTFLTPLHVESGIRAARNADHRVARVQALNAAIRAFAAEHPDQVYVVDWERIQRVLGEEKTIDYRFYYMYRAPFRKEFGEAYSAQVAHIARLLKGKVRKCLVLDADNTLWGGVVGEEGVDGIGLDPHAYPGRCYYEFQRSVLNLIQQGVIVAICSKNNEEDLFEVLDKHPHSLLRRSHLAAWRVNWNNKAENIAALARELNIGLDSMVFVDDSSMECQLIREALPDVTVVQVPSKVHELPRLLYQDALFDTLSVSSEDAQRTAMYVADREREGLKNQFASIDDYLASLELKATLRRATDRDLARVAQLLGKTNQFNLTTRRHPESAVRGFAADPNWAIYVMEAADKFSELGLVAVMMVRREGELGIVDTLLMSCRALGRRLEDVFVDWALARLETEWQVKRWQAHYIPTRKNAQVREFWAQAGFPVTAATDTLTTYELDSAARRRPQVSFVSIVES
jgi:FkbH-like protein